MTDLIERSIGPQIELRLDLPPAPPLPSVDANQIELAVLNLVVNARDAMPDGGVLTISPSEARPTLAVISRPESYVRLDGQRHGME